MREIPRGVQVGWMVTSSREDECVSSSEARLLPRVSPPANDIRRTCTNGRRPRMRCTDKIADLKIHDLISEQGGGMRSCISEIDLLFLLDDLFSFSLISQNLSA